MGPSLHGQQPVATPYDLRTDAYIGVGHLANLPNVFTGASAFHLMEGGWGYFVDAKHTFESRDDDDFFEAGMTEREARELGSRLVNEESAYTALSAGVIRAVHAEIAVYAGAGFTSRNAFQEFQDRRELADGEERLGDPGGHYWVEDAERSRSGVNAVGGIYLQAGRNLFIRLGGEAFPAGANLGLSLGFPR